MTTTQSNICTYHVKHALKFVSLKVWAVEKITISLIYSFTSISGSLGGDIGEEHNIQSNMASAFTKKGIDKCNNQVGRILKQVHVQQWSGETDYSIDDQTNPAFTNKIQHRFILNNN